MKVKKYGAGVFTIENFLSQAECAAYINMSENLGYEIATIQAISGPEINKEIRFNDRVIHDSSELACHLLNNAQAMLPTQIDSW